MYAFFYWVSLESSVALDEPASFPLTKPNGSIGVCMA